ncbi:Glycine oxidase [Acaryochloris thomasi RCC1774]|uniref:Glycine oxidase n=1 Tax=Acaryochloris thomasi RCC1774 TaxID=1764569 RepID=A0A2W1JFH5_9CYAN|nr:FAD-dependent oxidoreductase [Acaryochloris thomasi]PZD72409.1 Glycine oxidase [Acaryochloris thomasi RCC1774]
MKIAIVGCGIVGAAIAYTLSQKTDWEITVWDRRTPDKWEATGAALGVLMAVVRTRLKGKHVRLCLESLQCYESIIPQLEALTNIAIPYNRGGIVQLCFNPQDLVYWQKTQAMRQRQGFTLEILNRAQLLKRYPDLSEARQAKNAAVGAIYSPQDRQVDPVICAQALIKAAQLQGVQFIWQTPIQDFRCGSDQRVTYVVTETDVTPVDAVVITAGLDSQLLTAQLQPSLTLQPVLGQALRLKRPDPFAYPYPVVNGGDVHLVPLNAQELWVGATVEFPEEDSLESPQANPALLEQVLGDAIALDPTLATAEILQTWSGLRPRPDGRPAPVIETLASHPNVVLATAHYRNGVLLAPITAVRVQNLLAALLNDPRFIVV